MNSEKRTAVVTGASSGIGLGIAEAYLERGWNVVMNARNEGRLKDAAYALGRPDQIEIIAGDVGDPETGRRLVEGAVRRFGRVDVLVNNAGHFAVKPIGDYTPEDFDGFVGFFRGAYFATQAAVVQMRTQGGGAIVNITTVLAGRGVKAIPSSAPAAAKGGIDALTPSLAIELAADNIRVNTVAPGVVRTPLHGASDEQLDEFGPLHPLGRIGEVKDIVDAVLYLADARWVTGVVLPVDGGVSAGG